MQSFDDMTDDVLQMNEIGLSMTSMDMSFIVALTTDKQGDPQTIGFPSMFWHPLVQTVAQHVT